MERSRRRSGEWREGQREHRNPMPQDGAWFMNRNRERYGLRNRQRRQGRQNVGESMKRNREREREISGVDDAEWSLAATTDPDAFSNYSY